MLAARFFIFSPPLAFIPLLPHTLSLSLSLTLTHTMHSPTRTRRAWEPCD
jgi:hypothetical protein